jgi:hypothetical protein
MEDDPPKMKNGRRPFKKKWKTTLKIKMKDDPKKKN